VISRCSFQVLFCSSCVCIRKPLLQSGCKANSSSRQRGPASGSKGGRGVPFHSWNFQ
jgi:hypothetical protein